LVLAWSSDDRGIKRIKGKVDSERDRDIDKEKERERCIYIYREKKK